MNGTLTEQVQVRERAYRKFVNRKREHGSDLDDWLDAEREVMQEMGRSNSKKVGQKKRRVVSPFRT